MEIANRGRFLVSLFRLKLRHFETLLRLNRGSAETLLRHSSKQMTRAKELNKLRDPNKQTFDPTSRSRFNDMFLVMNYRVPFLRKIRDLPFCRFGNEGGCN